MRLLKHSTMVAYLALFLAPGVVASAAGGPMIVGVVASTTSNNSVLAGKLAPWKFLLGCKKPANSSSGYATLKITGTGEASGTRTLATITDNSGFTFVDRPQPIGTGYETTVDTNQQSSATIFLKSGSTTAQVQFLITVDDSVPQNCNVIGSAILITP